MNDLARDSKQIGNSIRRARRKQGLSQKVLGEKSGLRQETISLIENGNPSAKIATILSILGVLDLELQIAPRSKEPWKIEDHFAAASEQTTISHLDEHPGTEGNS